MPLVLNGVGTITGLQAGGLPDATVLTADIADANVTAAKLSGAQSGSAPIYGCRAWVNFDGTLSGTISPRASGNVTNVTKNGTGDYTINFTTAMPDANYAVSGAGKANPGVNYSYVCTHTRNTTSVRIQTMYGHSSIVDQDDISVAIFR